MSIDTSTLKAEERAAFELRALFSRYGYSRFKMSRFEQYDLYVRNKDFLVSDRMITFTDAGGALLALKPDVTISIIKNTTDIPGFARKVYYHENVYRADKGGSFRELMQTGLECVGELDMYHICEVIRLAVKSLEIISGDYVLDISHLGYVSGAMDAAVIPEEMREDTLKCIRGKNVSGLGQVCARAGVGDRAFGLMSDLLSSCGPIGPVIETLRGACANDEMRKAVSELESVYDVLRAAGLDDRIRIDFSLVNDMSYYSGLVFQGFVNGISSGVLSGGQYDKLMRKMGKRSGAIGFAVYLDELEMISRAQPDYDVDILLLYDGSTGPERLAEAVEEYIGSGGSVLAQRAVPEKLRYRRLLDLTAGGAK